MQWFRTVISQQGAGMAMDAAVVEHVFTVKMPTLALDCAAAATFECIKAYFLLVNESSGGLHRLSTADDDIETLIAPDRLLVSHWLVARAANPAWALSLQLSNTVLVAPRRCRSVGAM